MLNANKTSKTATIVAKKKIPSLFPLCAADCLEAPPVCWSGNTHSKLRFSAKCTIRPTPTAMRMASKAMTKPMAEGGNQNFADLWKCNSTIDCKVHITKTYPRQKKTKNMHLYVVKACSFIVTGENRLTENGKKKECVLEGFA